MMKWLAVLLLAAAQQLPTEIAQTKFDSGQNVVPVYEGWIPNPDGSFASATLRRTVKP